MDGGAHVVRRHRGHGSVCARPGGPCTGQGWEGLQLAAVWVGVGHAAQARRAWRFAHPTGRAPELHMTWRTQHYTVHLMAASAGGPTCEPLCRALPRPQVTTAGGAAVITMEQGQDWGPVQRDNGAGPGARGGARRPCPAGPPRGPAAWRACCRPRCCCAATSIPGPAGTVWNVTKDYKSGFFSSWNK